MFARLQRQRHCAWQRSVAERRRRRGWAESEISSYQNLAIWITQNLGFIQSKQARGVAPKMAFAIQTTHITMQQIHIYIYSYPTEKEPFGPPNWTRPHEFPSQALVEIFRKSEVPISDSFWFPKSFPTPGLHGILPVRLLPGRSRDGDRSLRASGARRPGEAMSGEQLEDLERQQQNSCC